MKQQLLRFRPTDAIALKCRAGPIARGLTFCCLMVFSFVALTACSWGGDRYGEQIGHIARQLRAEQTLSPDAGKRPTPVDGVDGKTARTAMDNYRQSSRIRSDGATTAVSGTIGNDTTSSSSAVR